MGKGLNDARVQRTLRVVRSAVAAFSRSYKKQRDLVVVQEQRGLEIHKLKVDIVTRWGSAYDMVERMLEQMDAVRNVLSKDRASSHLSPSWQDRDVLQSIAATLKGLETMTLTLNHDPNPKP